MFDFKAVNRDNTEEVFTFKANSYVDAKIWAENSLDCSKKWTVYNADNLQEVTEGQIVDAVARVKQLQGPVLGHSFDYSVKRASEELKVPALIVELAYRENWARVREELKKAK